MWSNYEIGVRFSRTLESTKILQPDLDFKNGSPFFKKATYTVLITP